MRNAGLDLDDLIALRRDIHQHAEGKFLEVRTSGKIVEQLLSYGLEEKDIRKVAVTGLEVDIHGTSEET